MDTYFFHDLRDTCAMFEQLLTEKAFMIADANFEYVGIIQALMNVFESKNKSTAKLFIKKILL